MVFSYLQTYFVAGVLSLSGVESCQVTTNLGKNLVANPQDLLTLNCSTINGNVTMFQWEKDGRLLNTSSMFTNRNITRNDAGSYQCSLLQGNETREKCSVFIKVNTPPDVTVTYCEVLRGVLKINCYIDAYPPPNVTWYKDGKKLNLTTKSDKIKYFVGSTQTDGQNYHSVLKKYHPDKTTFGNYTCLAENMHGRMAVARISQCEMIAKCPRFVNEETDVTVNVHLGETKVLSCQVLFYHRRSKLDFYQFVHISNSSGHANYMIMNQKIIMNYTIINATVNNSGDYQCSYQGTQNRKCNILVKLFHVMIQADHRDQLNGKNKKNIYIAIAVSITGGSLGLGLAIMFYCMRQRKIKSHILYESYPELHWDVFVSYSSEDYSWVKALCVVLEQPPFNLVVCLHHRDWELGRAIIDNMIESVYCSHKTLIIMSKNYLKSDYCMQELQIAMHSELGELSKERIVLLKIDDVPLSKLPRALRQKSYLDFSDSEQSKHFKTKLLRALPHRDILSGCNDDDDDDDDNDNNDDDDDDDDGEDGEGDEGDDDDTCLDNCDSQFKLKQLLLA